MKNSLIVTIASLCLLTGSAFADGHRHHHKHFKSHNHEAVSSQVSHVKTTNGFERTETKTNDKGQTATRNIKVVRDPESGVRTRIITGTDYEGDQYSGQTLSRKTENGFVRESQFTNSKGESTRRVIETTFDKEKKLVTKRIAITDSKGVTSEKVIEEDWSKKRKGKKVLNAS